MIAEHQVGTNTIVNAKIKIIIMLRFLEIRVSIVSYLWMTLINHLLIVKVSSLSFQNDILLH